MNRRAALPHFAASGIVNILWARLLLRIIIHSGPGEYIRRCSGNNIWCFRLQAKIRVIVFVRLLLLIAEL